MLVDGVDVRDYTQDALRSKIGFVPQKAFLFSGTVSSNVGYGEDNASGAAIRKAVAIAQAAEFVESPEVGYSGTVAQGRLELLRRAEAAFVHCPRSGARPGNPRL